MKPILFVDLDKSLIKIDILQTQLKQSFALSPWKTIKLMFQAHFRPERIKAAITPQIDIDPATLPYHEDVLALIHQAKGEGRIVVLATAAYHTIAQKVADYLKVFDAVLATTDTYNCKGAKKLAVMQEFAAGRPFDYVGDSHADLKIFKHTQTAYIVGNLKYSGNHQRIKG
jgi:phosphoserine phosphatase